jgi:hypothetical protein
MGKQNPYISRFLIKSTTPFIPCTGTFRARKAKKKNIDSGNLGLPELSVTWGSVTNSFTE